MKHLKIVVIVPQGQEYRLSSCFSADRLKSMQKRGLDIEVEKLVEPDADVDEFDGDAIIMDSRPDSEIHLRIPRSIYLHLNEKEFGNLARNLRFQMGHLDCSDKIFMNDIRSLCEYVIRHFPEDRYDNVFCKYMYATAGGFQYVDEKSKRYLTEIIENNCTYDYRNDYIHTGMLGTTFYLLARDESDICRKHEMMMHSLAYHELCSLNNMRFPHSYDAVEYALSMIEIGRMVNSDPSNHNIKQNAPYEKAVHIMKYQVVELEWPEIQKMESDRQRCNIDYLNYRVGIVEQRLSQVAPPEFRGLVEQHLVNVANRSTSRQSRV